VSEIAKLAGIELVDLATSAAPTVTWHLGCRDCVGSMEIKVFWLHGVCEVCGKTVPQHPNGIDIGVALTDQQLQELRAKRAEKLPTQHPAYRIVEANAQYIAHNVNLARPRIACTRCDWIGYAPVLDGCPKCRNEQFTEVP
jgi:hypothetical protein